MSENMKKIYQAYADSIAPAPDMQARLKRQLYAEMQGERPGKRNYGRGQFSRWLVVACMLFLVSGGCLTYAITRVAGQTGRENWIVKESTNENRLLGQKMLPLLIWIGIRKKKDLGFCSRCFDLIRLLYSVM